MIYKRSEWAYNGRFPDLKPLGKDEYFTDVCSSELIEECIEYFMTYQRSSSKMERELDQDQFNQPIELEEKVKPNNIFVRTYEKVKEYFK